MAEGFAFLAPHLKILPGKNNTSKKSRLEEDKFETKEEGESCYIPHMSSFIKM